MNTSFSGQQSEEAPRKTPFRIQTAPLSSFPASEAHNLSVTSSSVTGLDLSNFHPSYEEHAWALLRLYFANVDPLIRLLHKPSFYSTLEQFFRRFRNPQSIYGTHDPSSELVFENANENIKSHYRAQSQTCYLGDSYQQSHDQMRAFEALLFAIYHAAASSFTDCDACVNLYPSVQSDLPHSLENYRRATELALENAEFMQSEKLETLQALVLLLVCNQSRFLWWYRGL